MNRELLSFFVGDLWLKRLTAFCGFIPGAIVGWFCIKDGTLLTAYVAAIFEGARLEPNMFI